MICYLFAAGNGMRLRPLTEDIQKCMLPVGGKPMLEWWLDAAFRSECFDRVYVNLHHMHAKVDSWLNVYCSKKKRKVNRIDESSGLLGTAGTLFYHAEINEPYMTAYTDTFSRSMLLGGALPHLAAEWEQRGSGFAAGLVPFDPPDDNSTGRIETDETGTVVVGFAEKPSGTSKLMAWSGVMFGSKDSLDEIEGDDKDIARDFLPKLAGRMIMLGKVDAHDIGRGSQAYESIRERAV